MDDPATIHTQLALIGLNGLERKRIWSWGGLGDIGRVDLIKIPCIHIWNSQRMDKQSGGQHYHLLMIFWVPEQHIAKNAIAELLYMYIVFNILKMWEPLLVWLDDELVYQILNQCPNAHVQWLTTAHNSSTRGIWNFGERLLTSRATSIQLHKPRHTFLIKNNKMNLNSNNLSVCSQPKCTLVAEISSFSAVCYSVGPSEDSAFDGKSSLSEALLLWALIKDFCTFITFLLIL